ncbi:hypothetical protein Tco_1157576 [Tanacetum coccineum]
MIITPRVLPILVGRGFLETVSVVIDCMKSKGERITRLIFGVKEIGLGQEDTSYWTTIARRKSYEPRHSSNDIGLTSKSPSHGIDLWLQVQIFYDHVNPTISAEESWELIENLALYDHESWKDPRDFAKPVKAISLPQYVLSTSDLRLIELEN